MINEVSLGRQKVEKAICNLIKCNVIECNAIKCSGKYYHYFVARVWCIFVTGLRTLADAVHFNHVTGCVQPVMADSYSRIHVWMALAELHKEICYFEKCSRKVSFYVSRILVLT